MKKTAFSEQAMVERMQELMDQLGPLTHIPQANSAFKELAHVKRLRESAIKQAPDEPLAEVLSQTMSLAIQLGERALDASLRSGLQYGLPPLIERLEQATKKDFDHPELAGHAAGAAARELLANWGLAYREGTPIDSMIHDIDSVIAYLQEFRLLTQAYARADPLMRRGEPVLQQRQDSLLFTPLRLPNT